MGTHVFCSELRHGVTACPPAHCVHRVHHEVVGIDQDASEIPGDSRSDLLKPHVNGRLDESEAQSSDKRIRSLASLFTGEADQADKTGKCSKLSI